MPRRKPHTRQTIERIRESIDCKAAVSELHAIGHDKDMTPSVRVKALQVLLDRVMPALTQADITSRQEQPGKTYEEIRSELIGQHGEPLALLLLKEISPSEYFARTGKQEQDTVETNSKADHVMDSMNDKAGKAVIKAVIDVLPSHPSTPKTIQ
jgi:hypothetical protein